MGAQKPGEPLPRVVVLGVVTVRKHRGAHVPLKYLQRQGMPRVHWRGLARHVGDHAEPPLLVQREAASVRQVGELVHTEGGPTLEVLDALLGLLGGPPLVGEPAAQLILGHEVASRAQTHDRHDAIIAFQHVGPPRVIPPPGGLVARRRRQPHLGRDRLMVGCMPDAIFEHPRLVAIYDPLDPDRSDLDVYAAIADDFGVHRVLDVGCGTGTFALLLADRGLEVTGVDPAAGSLAVARAKPGAGQVRWIHGDAAVLPPMQVDLATMTGNVAQAIVDAPDWGSTLRGVHDALRPDGHLVFETRDPAYRGWQKWNRAATYRCTEIQGTGAVESWVELTDVSGPLVSFRCTWVSSPTDRC